MTNYEKGNITRLKNLLKQYRDHIITKQYNFFKNVPHNYEIVDVIDLVDTAIELIVGGL